MTEPIHAPKPTKRSLVLETTCDGLIEAMEIGEDAESVAAMGAMGWIRADELESVRVAVLEAGGGLDLVASIRGIAAARDSNYEKGRADALGKTPAEMSGSIVWQRPDGSDGTPRAIPDLKTNPVFTTCRDCKHWAPKEQQVTEERRPCLLMSYPRAKGYERAAGVLANAFAGSEAADLVTDEDFGCVYGSRAEAAEIPERETNGHAAKVGDTANDRVPFRQAVIERAQKLWAMGDDKTTAGAAKLDALVDVLEELVDAGLVPRAEPKREGKLPSERLKEIADTGSALCALSGVRVADPSFAIHAVGIYLDERLGRE